MLTKEERAELEALKKDPDVKLAVKAAYDKERQMLYKYRYLKKTGDVSDRRRGRIQGGIRSGRCRREGGEARGADHNAVTSTGDVSDRRRGRIQGGIRSGRCRRVGG